MTAKLSQSAIDAWRKMLTLQATAIESIDTALADHGCIPLNWYDVLVELVDVPDRRLRMHEIAARVLLTRSGITRITTKLEQEGLIRREIDPVDRRGAYAVLTEAGYAAVRKAWPIYAQGIEQHFARHLSDDEAASLIALFDRMIKAQTDSFM